MAYTFADSGTGSLLIYVDGVFQDAIAGAEVRYKKNTTQNYVELSDGQHTFYSINISDISGAADLDDVLDAIEAALPDTGGGGGGDDEINLDGTEVAATAQAQEFTNGITSSSGDYEFQTAGYRTTVDKDRIEIEDNASNTSITISRTSGHIRVSDMGGLAQARMDKDGTISGVNLQNPDALSTPDKAIKINGVLCYRALLTQTGTNAPTITLLENTLGATVSSSRDIKGRYFLTASSAVFAAGKTFVLIGSQSTDDPDSPVISMRKKRIDASNIALITSESGASVDDGMENTEIQILVYP